MGPEKIMSMYFDTKKQQELIAAAKSWIGVNYRHLGKGRGGCDCAHFIGGILVDIGIIDQIESQYYSRDWYVHGTDEILLDGLQRHIERFSHGIYGKFFDYAGERLLIGDILCMKLYSDTCPHHHAALMLDGNRIIHCLESKGVYVADFHYRWIERTFKYYRLFRKDN